MLSGEVADTDGGDAAELIRRMGMDLFPWERDVLSCWCSIDGAGNPSYSSCGLSVPRQNGKNAILEAFELYELVAAGWHVLHTAHRVKTSKKSFQRLVRYFTDRRHPDVHSLVENIRYTNGEEGIYLSNGGSVEFSARSRAGARGFDDINLVVFDEAQDLTDDQLNAIMYTLAASSTGERVMVFTGTPPDPGSPGEVFGRTRAAALSGREQGSCWHEWSVAELPAKGSSFEDLLDDVYAANPSMGYTLSEDFTAKEFAKASLDGFARERLGWWSAARANAAVDPALWEAAARDAAPDLSGGYKKAFGVKFSADGSQVALSVCALPDGGPPHVELVGQASLAEGVGWISEYLERAEPTTAAVALDGRNGMEALLDRLRGAYPRQAVMVPGTRGVVAAASLLDGALRDRAVTRFADPGQAALDHSALSSVKRPIGSDGGWGFGGEDSAAIESASLALWAAKNTRRSSTGGCEVI